MEDSGPLLVKEGPALDVEDALVRIGRGEIADAAAVVDDVERLEIVESAHHGIWVDAEFGSQVADRGDAVLGSPLAEEETFGDRVGYLEVDRFLFFKIHICSIFHVLETVVGPPKEESAKSSIDSSNDVADKPQNLIVAKGGLEAIEPIQNILSEVRKHLSADDRDGKSDEYQPKKRFGDLVAFEDSGRKQEDQHMEEIGEEPAQGNERRMERADIDKRYLRVGIP